MSYQNTRENERGFAAIWTAMLLFFLIGATALAVDVSGFYRDARFDQRTADLTCLAGVRDLPGPTAGALATAVEYAQANWDVVAPLSDSGSGDQAVLDDGAGNIVTITAGVGGDSAKMQVEVSKRSRTFFARVLNATSVQVKQLATCKSFGRGLGDLPFGAVPGSFDGILQTKNPCDTGNCRALDLPRSDSNGSGKWFIRNVALGSELTLVPHLAAIPQPADPTLVCSATNTTCSVIDQNQGVSAGQLSDGLVRGSNSAAVDGRLENPVTSTTVTTPGGRVIDADSYLDILRSGSEDPPVLVDLANFPQAPPDWLDQQPVMGAWPDFANGAIYPGQERHLYYDGVVAKCDSPRLASVPIIANLDWEPGNAVALPNGNSDPVKVVGSLLVIIDDPNDAGDFKNSDSIKTASSWILWLGPDAGCAGPNGQIGPFEPGDAKVTRLVDNN